MPLAGEAAPDPTPLPTAATMASPPSRSTTPPSARVSRLLPSANVSIRPGVPVFFFTRSLSLYHYIEFAPPPRLGYQTPLDKRPSAPPLPTKIFVQHSPFQYNIARLLRHGRHKCYTIVQPHGVPLGTPRPPRYPPDPCADKARWARDEIKSRYEAFFGSNRDIDFKCIDSTDFMLDPNLIWNW